MKQVVSVNFERKSWICPWPQTLVVLLKLVSMELNHSTIFCMAFPNLKMRTYHNGWNLYFNKKKYFGSDCSILLEFSQFLDLLWYIFSQKKCLFACVSSCNCVRLAKKSEGPLIIFHSSQIQHSLVFEQDFRYKEIHIKW